MLDLLYLFWTSLCVCQLGYKPCQHFSKPCVIPVESATVRHIRTCKITRQTEICSKFSILVLFTIVKLLKPNWNMAKILILEPAAKYFLQVWANLPMDIIIRFCHPQYWKNYFTSILPAKITKMWGKSTYLGPWYQ